MFFQGTPTQLPEVLVDLEYSFKHERAYTKEWFQTADHDWFSYDLGVETDKRVAEISFEAPTEDAIAIEQYLLDASDNGGAMNSLVVGFSEFGEEVFGVDVDYSVPLACVLIGEPSFEYIALDWARVSFTLMLDPAHTVTLKTLPSGIGWDSIPWKFAVSRRNDTGKKIGVPYTGEVSFVYDDATSFEIDASFSLTRNEAIWLKLTLMTARENSFTIPNTYFNLTGRDTDANNPVVVKIKDYEEGRDGVNLYSFKLEFFIHG